MNERERIEQNNTIKPSADAGDETESLEQIRETANKFLDAGDEAIRRALSRDREEFLHANRQRGGQ